MPKNVTNALKLEVSLMSRSLALHVPPTWITDESAALLTLATAYDKKRDRIQAKLARSPASASPTAPPVLRARAKHHAKRRTEE